MAAVPAGIAAGVTYDATASVVTGKDQGYVAAFKNAAVNPSAGSIIDAASIPVSDALAGYSGGEIANAVELYGLENAKEEALEMIEDVSIDGQRLDHANRAKAYHPKIEMMKHGTSHFFDDPKTGTVVPEASTSDAAVPVPDGCADEQKWASRQRRGTNSTSSTSVGFVDVLESFCFMFTYIAKKNIISIIFGI